jgi:hypothetical protein
LRAIIFLIILPFLFLSCAKKENLKPGETKLIVEITNNIETTYIPVNYSIESSSKSLYYDIDSRQKYPGFKWTNKRTTYAYHKKTGRYFLVAEKLLDYDKLIWE